jgi:hypothetical protein
MKELFLRRWSRAALRRGQGKAGNSSQDFPLLGRERALEAIGIDDLLALLRRHGAQVADRGSYHALPIRRQLQNLIMNLLYLSLLLRRQALPLPHAVHQLEHVLLLLWRKAREISQLLP